MFQVNESLCHYIFNQNAGELFQHLRAKTNQDDQEFSTLVDNCLEISMKVNRHIFNKDRALPLYSVNAYNEGCHMYCFRVLNLKMKGVLTNEDKQLDKTDDNRFLLLSFFLSSVLLANNATNFNKVFFQAMKELGLKPPEGCSKKLFKAFVLDERKERENAARSAYHRVFQTYMQTLFKSENGPLYAELDRLAHDNLLVPSKAERYREQSFYTYPTFAALIFLNEKVVAKEFPILIKVRVITADGILKTLQHQFGSFDRKTPALIFEGIASDSVDVETFRKEAQQCARYYRRKPTHHAEDVECKFCRPVPDEKSELIDPFKRNFEAAMKVDNLFQLLAAEGGNQQECFLPLFSGKYEVLSKISNEAQPLINEFGLSEKAPKGFSIFRVYVDLLENIRENEAPFFEVTPEQFINNTFFSANSTKQAENSSRRETTEETFRMKDLLVEQALTFGSSTAMLVAESLKTPNKRNIRHAQLLLRASEKREVLPSSYQADLRNKNLVEKACRLVMESQSSGEKSDRPLTLQARDLLKSQKLKL